MEELFRHYWWLMFPLFWFCMAGCRMWMHYRQQQAWLEVIKTYAAQGKDPPAELARAMRPHADPGEAWREFRSRRLSDDDMPFPPFYGRRGPYGEWRRVILFTGLAAGFFIASTVTESGGAAHGFQVVAIIMTVLAASFGAMAILGLYLSRPPRPDDR